MPGKMHFLNDSDLKKVKRVIASNNAGRSPLSQRPLPTRRPPRGRDSQRRLRKAVITETGGIAAAELDSGDIVPTTGTGNEWGRPADPTDNWPALSEITLIHVGGDALDEDAVVWIDDQNVIVNQDCTALAEGA